MRLNNTFPPYSFCLEIYEDENLLIKNAIIPIINNKWKKVLMSYLERPKAGSWGTIMTSI